ncbi:MAG: hypothetical protein Q7J48_16900 [Nocardioides sp.]|nr:hypothetical protein [Nocardioides sp.]
MRMRRSFVAVAAAWLVVVAIGSTLVWAVISRVGDGLVTTADSSVAPSTSSPTPSRTPSPKPSRTPSPKPSRTPSTSPTTSPPSSPVSSPPVSSPPSSAAPVSRSATWQGLGGVVVAECTGDAIRTLSVLADPGFRVEVGNPGPEQLEVEFEGREDEEGSESKVRAVCVAGAPQFSAETES